jgi:hypothetical protein
MDMRRLWPKTRKSALLWLSITVSILLAGAPAAAQQSPGTTITNTSTATFQDINAVSYSSTSNTISTTVQNAPSMTISAPVAQSIAPNQIVLDTFTLTNTGNAAGNFQVAADAAFSGTASSTTLMGYVINSTATGTCSIASPCTLSTLATQLTALSATASGSSISVGVEYQAALNANPNQTITTSLSPTVAYPSLGSAGSVTSASETGTVTDTVLAQARLDVQATGSTPSSSAQAITWTITANNGGNFGAYDLLSAKTLFGATNPGIAIFAKLPSFAGSLLGMTTTPTAILSGASLGATATLYYSTATSVPDISSNWSTTYTASATYLAVYISGGSVGMELPSAPGGSGGVGSVSTPQVTLTFATNQPSGGGASSLNSVTVLSNADIGGKPGATSLTPIVGPGILLGTTDGSGQALTATESNATPSNVITPPGGASNAAGSEAYSVASVVNGPLNNPGAMGSYPASPNAGAGSATNNLDYTAIGFACATGSGVNDGSTLCTVPSGGVVVPNTVENTGSSSDTFTLTAYAPTGWTVQLFNATCATPNTTIPTCTQGASITSASSSGGNISGSVTIAAAASLTYEAVYIASSGVTPFVGVDAKITAAGTAGGAVDTNDTHNDIYPGGVVTLSNSLAVMSTNCPSGTSSSPPAGTVCPGGVLHYTLAYANIAPAAAVGSHVGTEPSFAYAALIMTAGTLVDDGTATGNTWGADSFGLSAAASDTVLGTTFAYYSCTPSCAPTNTFASGTYPILAVGPNKFTATIGGSGSYQIVPGASGAITFNVTVR